jgi:hypothetical protein
MRSDDVPVQVRRFLNRSALELAELEVLLLLHGGSNRYWDDTAVADQLRLTRPAAASHLESLARRSLLDVRIGEGIHYRYGPVTPRLTEAVDRLAEAWLHHREAILVWVVSRRKRSLTDFSDAFRFTGGQDEDG